MIIVLGIDGLGSDIFLEALGTPGTPGMLEHLKGLKDTSAYSMHARADMSTRSSENWGTHFYGNGPAYHGWYRSDEPVAVSGAISVFDVVGNSTGCTRWPPLVQKIPSFRLGGTACTLAAVRNRSNDLVVGVWDDVDDAGHAGSDRVAALKRVDGLIGTVLAARLPGDHVMVISDHGTRPCRWYEFACVAHYGGRTMELNTPLLVSGPGVSPGELKRPVTHQDTSRYILG